jgi:Uma2 family endonuclease
MAAEPKSLISREAYLAMDRASEERHEFIAGEVFAMVGGTIRHDIIFGNVFVFLRSRLLGSGCEVFSSNMRITIPQLDIYTFPDISVVCGAEDFEDDQEDTLLNPIVLIEILSPSTESYDRGRKYHRYQHIRSFREYVLIAQDAPVVDHCIRQPDGRWLCSTVEGLDADVTLPSLNCTISLREIYARVRFE